MFLRNNSERTAIGFLPQGENIRVVFCFERILFAKPKFPPFDVLIKYENIKGKAYKENGQIGHIAVLRFRLTTATENRDGPCERVKGNRKTLTEGL